jgi:hypothetical protein
VRDRGITGLYSDPGHVILYTSNGDARQEFSNVLTARPSPGSESGEIRRVAAPDVPGYVYDRPDA